MTANAFKILTAEQWAQFEADGVFHGALTDGKWQHRKVASEILAGPAL